MNFKYLLKNTYLGFREAILKVMLRPKELRQIDPGAVISIVVIRIDRIGDTVVSLPAIKALKDMFPACHLAVVLQPQNLLLLENTSWIDELIPYRSFIQSVKLLRKKNFYMAIDFLMDYSLKTALIAFLSKANVRVGFDIEARGRFFNLTVKPGSERKHMSKHILDLIRLVGGACGKIEESIEESDPRLFISEQDKFFADEFLKQEGIKSEEILCGLHPGGYFPSQSWTQEGFAELAQRISQKYNARIIIVASAQEKRLVYNLASLMKTKPVLALGLTLDKLASIIARMDIFICNHSGPLHIACALGVPTVSTMGPTDPALWWPHGKDHIVIRHDLPCSPCNFGSCRKHKCMESITVSEMEEAVDAQIGRIIKTPDWHE